MTDPRAALADDVTKDLETLDEHWPQSAARLRKYIAALRASSAPAEPVAWLWEYIGDDAYVKLESPFIARTLKELDPNQNPWPETWIPLRPLFDVKPAPPPVTRGLIVNRPAVNLSFHGRLFQAHMWREYAVAIRYDRVTRTGVGRRWCIEIGRMNYAECVRRSRVNLYLARRLNRAQAIARLVAGETSLQKTQGTVTGESGSDWAIPTTQPMPKYEYQKDSSVGGNVNYGPSDPNERRRVLRETILAIMSDKLWTVRDGVTVIKGMDKAADAILATLPVPDRAKPDDQMVLHPLSDIRELDEAVHLLGIQDSTTSLPDAIRALQAELEALHAALAACPVQPVEPRK